MGFKNLIKKVAAPVKQAIKPVSTVMKKATTVLKPVTTIIKPVVKPLAKSVLKQAMPFVKSIPVVGTVVQAGESVYKVGKDIGVVDPLKNKIKSEIKQKISPTKTAVVPSVKQISKPVTKDTQKSLTRAGELTDQLNRSIKDTDSSGPSVSHTTGLNKPAVTKTRSPKELNKKESSDDGFFSSLLAMFGLA